MPRRRIVKCATCGHHFSIHHYDPAEQGRKPPARCGVPGCKCKRYCDKRPGWHTCGEHKKKIQVYAGGDDIRSAYECKLCGKFLGVVGGAA